MYSLGGLLPRILACGALAWCGVSFGCSTDSQTTPVEPALSDIDLSCPGAALSPSPLRRLTRVELANSVRDVFGVDLPTEDLFPRDEVALGFDNQAGSLSVTDRHVQGYLESSGTVAERLTQSAEQLETLAGCAPESEECARRMLVRLGRRLERRDLAEAEVDTLLELFGGDYTATGFREGAARAIEVLLQSPEFVYRIERSPTAALGERQPASPWTLATRLSFLLWGSGPDDELLDDAAQNRLSTAADVERAARRLLESPRAKRGVLHFYLQWLQLSDLDEVEKDERLFDYWDDSLRTDLGRETARFLEEVLWKDGARFQTLLTADYTFANAALQDFYGLRVTADPRELSRTQLPSGSGRGGILTQGAVLSKQAKANQTDPIHRGKFIREQFFCSPPPPPPPDLVVSPPVINASKTTRERFSEHREQPACNVCHEQLDPVGFLFEHYDAIGRYRAVENGLPVDATGYVANSDIEGPLDGVAALSARLAESKQVRSCVVKQWFRYGFGRGETEQDRCTLEKLEGVFERSGGNLRQLLIAMTQTDPFLYDAPAPELDEVGP